MRAKTNRSTPVTNLQCSAEHPEKRVAFNLLSTRYVISWLLCAVLMLLANQARAVSYTVTLTTDVATGTGTSGTLRYVLAQAAASAGADTVTFAIPAAGMQTIVLGSALSIPADVTIDGFTQGSLTQGNLMGGVVNTTNIYLSTTFQVLINGNNVTLRGVAIGNSTGSASTLNILQVGSATPAKTGVVIEGCYVGFTGAGADAAVGAAKTGILLDWSSGTVVRNCAIGNINGVGLRTTANTSAAVIDNCFIGTTPAGDTAKACGAGIALSGTTMDDGGVRILGSNNTIMNSLVSGNSGVGIGNAGGSGTIITGNIIGMNRLKTAKLANTLHGIELMGGANWQITNNVVAGNTGTGIFLWEYTGFLFTGTGLIQNNAIGTTTLNGTISNMGNGRGGIYVDNDLDSATTTSTQIIGNTIAYNLATGTLDAAGTVSGNNPVSAGAGIGIGPAATPVCAIGISQNSIYNNSGLGIDLVSGSAAGVTANDAGDTDSGPNDLLNFPIITSVTWSGASLVITGECRIGAIVEFFTSDLDATYGEGKYFIGSFVESSAADPNSAAGTTDTTAKKFTFTFVPLGPVATTDKITATASGGSLVPGTVGRTSEFAVQSAVVPALPTTTVALGNLVWNDDNANGAKDGTETGIAGVTVQVRLASDNSLVTSTLTDASGNWMATQLTSGVSYKAFIPAVMFQANGPLANRTAFGQSSSNTTYDDNLASSDNSVFESNPAVNGVYSTAITVTAGSAPIDSATGPTLEFGSNKTQDNIYPGDTNGNMTIDFAMTPRCSIGNLVWNDVNDNGIKDSTESGIAGVVVNLYRGGVSGTPLATVTTDAGGSYRFANLPPRPDYMVQVAASNFIMGSGPLARMISSTGQEIATSKLDDGTASSDNGDDNTNSAVVGVATPAFALSATTSPLNSGTETGYNNTVDDRDGDAAGDMTIDFGFRVPAAGSCPVGNMLVNPSFDDPTWAQTGTSTLAGHPAKDIPKLTSGALPNWLMGNQTAGINGEWIKADSIGGTTAKDGSYLAFLPTDTGIPCYYQSFASLNQSNTYQVAVWAAAFNPTTPTNSTADVNIEFTVASVDTPVQPVSIVSASPGATTVAHNLAGTATSAATASVIGAQWTIKTCKPLATDGTAWATGKTLDWKSLNWQLVWVRFTPNYKNLNVLLSQNGPTSGGVVFDGAKMECSTFTKYMAIGNNVFIDADGNGANTSATEGVNDVTVQLLDTSNTVLARTCTTNAGRYLFTGLAAGTYRVQIPASEFASGAPLFGKVSVGPAVPTDTSTLDDDKATGDNGIDAATPATTGIVSNDITLVQDAAPADSATAENGFEKTWDNSISDNENNYNLTIDFGFAAPSLDFGDLADTSSGTGAGDYQSLNANNGPRHTVTAALKMGATNTTEGDALQNTAANGDSSDDGVATLPTLTAGSASSSFSVSVTNTGAAAKLSVWIDFNNDGSFNDTVLDAAGTNGGEKIATDLAVATSATSVTVPGIVKVPAAAYTSGAVGMRLRLSTAAVLTSLGAAPDGEVEDYAINVASVSDYGDWAHATTPSAATSAATSITSTNVRLGATVDADTSVTPNAAATADDTTGSDDEDGVTMPSSILQGQSVTIPVTVFNNNTIGKYLQAWIDFDNNGTFNDVDVTTTGGERIYNLVTPASPSQQTINVTFTVPATASVGTQRGVRFRISDNAATTPTSSGATGEIEDYVVTIQRAYPALCLTSANQFSLLVTDIGFSMSSPDSGVYGGTGFASGVSINASAGGLQGGVTVDPPLVGNLSGADTLPGTGGSAIAPVLADVSAARTEAINMSATVAAMTATQTIGSTTSDLTITSSGTNNIISLATLKLSGGAMITLQGGPNDYFFINVGDEFSFSGSSGMVLSGGVLAQHVIVNMLPGSTNLKLTGASAAYSGTFLSTQVTNKTALTGASIITGSVYARDVTLTGGSLISGRAFDCGVVVPTSDFGDAAPFPIASQKATVDIRIGTNVTDAEPSAQLSTNATGDDTTGTDDEDLTMPSFTEGVATNLVIPVTIPVLPNISASTSRLGVFVDWNGNGIMDAGETITAQTIATAGTSNVTFSLTPPIGSAGTCFLRLRITEGSTATSFSGVSTLKGEVEDYAITVVNPVDYGDWNGSGAATATTSSMASTSLRLGATIDGETSVTPDAGAIADGADEDGVTMPAVLAQGLSVTIPVSVFNNNTAGRYLQAWVDFDNNGAFNDVDVATAGGERVYNAVTAANAALQTVNVTFTVPAGASVGTQRGVRFRISDNSATTPTSSGAVGEIEDYVVDIVVPQEFGDATGYASATASQLAGTPKFGALVDYEGAQAADDNTIGADEDGVYVATSAILGKELYVNYDANTTAGAFVNIWVDWNRDGDFADAGEQVVTNVSHASRTTGTLKIPVPLTATPGASWLRARISSAGGAGPTGLTSDGEIEDHPVTIADSIMFSGVVFEDANNNGQRDAGERLMPGVQVGVKDVIVNSQLRSSVFTDASGAYQLTVPPGTWRVAFWEPTFGGFTFATPNTGSDLTDSDVIYDSLAGTADTVNTVLATGAADVANVDCGLVPAANTVTYTAGTTMNTDAWSSTVTFPKFYSTTATLSSVRTTVTVATSQDMYLENKAATSAFMALSASGVRARVTFPTGAFDSPLVGDSYPGVTLNADDSVYAFNPAAGLTYAAMITKPVNRGSTGSAPLGTTGYQGASAADNMTLPLVLTNTNTWSGGTTFDYKLTTYSQSGAAVTYHLEYRDYGDHIFGSVAASSASQLVSADIRIGTNATDAEGADTSDTAADKDNTTGTNDEDLTMLAFTVGTATNLNIPVTIPVLASLSGSTSRINVFVDWNGDGDVGDANETQTAQTAATAGTNTITFSLTPPLGTTAGTKYLRIRITEGSTAPAFSGVVALKGEVEDYAVTVNAMTVGGLAYEDKNFNGQYDAATDAVVNGAVVTLYQDLTGNGITADDVTSPYALAGLTNPVTPAGSVYSFANLPAGSYFVKLKPASGTWYQGGSPVAANPALGSKLDNRNYGNLNGLDATAFFSPVLALTTGGQPASAVDGDDANTDSTIDFGLWQRMTLGNLVWNDADNGGTVNGAEAGVNGVTVELFKSTDAVVNNGGGDDVSQGATATATVSTVAGTYSFAGLLPGNYYVKVTPTSSLQLKSSGAGTDDGTNNDNNGTSQTSQGQPVYSHMVVLTANGEPGSTAGGGNAENTIDIGLRACPAINITPASLAAGTQWFPYSQTITGAGGTGAITLTQSGSLPAGLSWSGGAGTATISGTPTVAGSFPITVTGTDPLLCTASINYTITVNACGAIAIAPAAALSATLGTAHTTTFSGSGGSGSYTWTMSPTPLSGQAAWWTGENSSLDVTGSANGSQLNGVSFAAGKMGRAFSFDGVDDAVSVTDSAALKPAQISLEAWVYASAAQAAGSTVVMKTTSSAATDGYGLGYVSATQFGFWINAAATNRVVTSAALSTGAWHHVVGTYDGATIRLYVDGVQVGTGAAYAAAITHSAQPLLIGRSAGGAGWLGQIDEVALYNRALTAAEVSANYAGSNAVASLLPSGITFNGATPAINGTPVAPSPAGSYPFTIRAMDTTGCFGRKDYTLALSCPVITFAGTPPAAYRGVAYSTTITAGAGTGTYSWSVSGLPAGLSAVPGGVNNSVLTISGTTNVATGSFSASITANDGSGCSGSTNPSIVVKGLGIGNFVYQDVDYTGTFAGADTALASATVTLYTDSGVAGPDAGDVAVVQAGVTNPVTSSVAGVYGFAGLAPGSYYVKVKPASGTWYAGSNIISTNPAIGSKADNENYANLNALDTTAFYSPTLVLAVGGQAGAAVDGDDTDTDSTIDFALWQRMSLGNLVWNDADNGGTVNGAEAGVNGVTVELFKSTDAVVNNGGGDDVSQGTTTTATVSSVAGTFGFAGLIPGNYYLKVTPTATLQLKSSGAGTDNGTDNDNNGTSQASQSQPVYTHMVVLTANNEPGATAGGGNAENTIDVGLRACPPVVVGPGSLANARQWFPYSATFTGSGGTGAITLTQTGALPAGILFTGGVGTATISGSATVSGSFPFTVRGTDPVGCFVDVNYTLVVDALTGLTVSPASVGAAVLGTAYDTGAFTSTGTGAKTFVFAPTPPSGVAGFYAGEGNSLDLSGSLHGVQKGTVGFVAGKYGQAFNLPATGYIEVADAAALRPAQVTVEAWVYSNGLQTAWAGVVTKSTSSAWTDGYGLDFLGDGTTLKFWVNNYSTAGVSTTLSASTWTHVVGTYDGTTVRLFKDGVQVGSGTAYAGGITHSVQPLRIGSALGGSQFSGRLDEVAVYGRALTPAEVSARSAAVQTPSTVLPSGVAWNAATPNAAGTPAAPSAPGSYPFTVRATDSLALQGRTDYVIALSCPAVVVTPSIATAYRGVTYTSTLTAAGGTGSYTWSVSGLPAGLTATAGGVNNSVYTISGSATAVVGAYPLTVTATDSNNCSGASSPTITLKGLGLGGLAYEDVNFNGQYDAGTDVPMTGASVSIYNDATGNGIDATDALVSFSGLTNPQTTSGTGLYNFSGLEAGRYFVKVTPGSGTWYQGGFPITTNPVLASKVNGKNYGNLDALAAASFFSPVATLSPSGQPAVGVDGDDGDTDSTFDFGLWKRLSIGNLVWNDLDNGGTVNGAEAGVNGATVQLFKSTDGVVNNGAGDDVSQGTTTTATVSTVVGTYGFTGLLPGNYYLKVTPTAGLQLRSSGAGSDNGVNNDNNGTSQVSQGQPVYTHMVVLTANSEPGVTAGGGNVENTIDVGLRACPPVVISPGSLAGATQWFPYSVTFTGSGGTGAITLTETGALPAGLTFAGGVGSATITGTPTVAGSFPITVTGTDPLLCTGSQAYTLVVNPCGALSINPAVVADATLYQVYSQSFAPSGGTGPFVWTVSATPPSGQAGWWGMEGNSLDFNGTSHGSQMGGVAFTATAAGKTGRALSLDGVNDYLEIPDSAALRPSQFTAEAWVYPLAGQAANAVVMRKTTSASMTDGWGMGMLADGTTFAFWGGNNTTNRVTTTLTTGAWTHVAGTYDGATLRLYVNGVQVGGGFALGSVTMSTQPLRIGGGGGVTAPWKGYIDEAGFYNRALSQPEIAGRVSGANNFNSYAPTGLAWDAATPKVSGTPVAPARPGIYPLTVRVVDAGGCQARSDYGLAVSCPSIVITGGSLPAMYRGVGYAQNVSASGGTGPYTWSVSAGAMPSGLSIHPTSGAITGLSLAPAGLYSFTLRALDTDNNCFGTLSTSIDLRGLSLGNYVFADSNNDGLAAGELPMAGAILDLFSSTDMVAGNGDDVPVAGVASQTSDAAGFYRFTGLAIGRYVVRVTPPAAYGIASSLAAGDNGVDNDNNGSQPGGTNSAIYSPVITLAVGGEPGTTGTTDVDDTIDFGLAVCVVGNDLANASFENGTFTQTTGTLSAGQPDKIAGHSAVYMSAVTDGASAASHPTGWDIPDPAYWVNGAAGGGAFDQSKLVFQPAKAGASPVIATAGYSFGFSTLVDFQFGVWAAAFDPSNPTDSHAVIKLQIERPVSAYAGASANVLASNPPGGVNSLLNSNRLADVTFPEIVTKNPRATDGSLFIGSAGQVLDWKSLNWVRFTVKFRCNVNALKIKLAQADSATSKGAVFDAGELYCDTAVPAYMNVGNLVFNDVNYNGHYDSGEGLDNVNVRLFRSTQNPATDVPFLRTTTTGGGKYWFAGLPADTYIVNVPASEFADGRPLNGMISATGVGADAAGDDGVDENGRDDTTVVSVGVSTGGIALANNSEPVDAGTETGFDKTWDNADDNNTDLTVDFGFVPAIAVGNLVFDDVNGNGKYDAGDAGIPSVTVNLFRAGDSPASATPVATTTTAADGTYLFTGLNVGSYFVQIPPANFWVGSGALARRVSSPGQDSGASGDDDVNENGDNPVNTATAGVRSANFTVANNTMPRDTGTETGFGKTADNTTPGDGNGNLTIDFGFTAPASGANCLPGTLAANPSFELGTWTPAGTFVGSNYSLPVTNVSPASWSASNPATLWIDGAAAGGSKEGNRLVWMPPQSTEGPTVTSAIASASLADTYQVCVWAAAFDPLDPQHSTARATVQFYSEGSPTPVQVLSSSPGGTPSVAGAGAYSVVTWNLQTSNPRTTTGAAYTGAVGQVLDWRTLNWQRLCVRFKPNYGSFSLLLGHEQSTSNGIVFDGVDLRCSDYPPSLNVGNLVFNDLNDNGVYDAGEGVDRVALRLFAEGASVSSIPLATTSTANGGQYLFSGLAPGNYFIHIPASEFATSGSLFNRMSVGGEGTSDADDDSDENGQDGSDLRTEGVVSNVFTLSDGGEPVDSGTETGFGKTLDNSDDGATNLTVDFGFIALRAAAVYAILEMSDGRVLIGGDFRKVGGVARRNIARLNADGTVDESFDPGTGFSGPVYSLALDQASGLVVAGGAFERFNGSSTPRVARLQATGARDPGFASPFTAPAASDVVNWVSLDGSSRIYVAGKFSSPRNGLARLDWSTGAVDAAFNPSGTGFSGSTVYEGAWLAASQLVLAGNFTSYNGGSANRVAKIDISNGNAVTWGSAGFDGTVNSLSVNSVGSVFAGGTFGSAGGASRNKVALIKADGSVDSSFASPTAGTGSLQTIQLNSIQKIRAARSYRP